MFPFFSLVGLEGCKLGLTQLSASHTVPFNFDAFAGLKVQRNGDVQEKAASVWTSQNPETEWFTQRCKIATIGDAFEAFLSGTGHTPTGSPLDTWIAINADLVWELEELGSGTKQFLGTLQIRRIAVPSSIVSAPAAITVTVQLP